jgi:hypothetical protein
MSGQEVTQGDRSGHFFVKFRLTVFAPGEEAKLTRGKKAICVSVMDADANPRKAMTAKVSRNETLRPFRSRFCDSKSPREDFQPSARKLLKMEAYENHIAKCSRPRVRTGIRARFLLWRRRPAPSKQHRPIATRGRDGSDPNSADRGSTGRNLNPTGCKPADRNAARRSPSGGTHTSSGAARDQYQSGQGRSGDG